MKRLLITFTCLLFLLLEFVKATNWAQVSGNKYQNANTNSETRWSPRWGHTAAALMLQRPEPCEYPEGTDLGLTEEELEERKKAKSLADDKKILVMGGDFHKSNEGGGYYTNEVWSSTGAIWKTVNSTIEFDFRNDPIPRIISDAKWKLVSPNKEVPLGVSYNLWTACCSKLDQVIKSGLHTRFYVRSRSREI
tara:strand:+ start:1395 stop:1973 length:579 start_codon:yes stop_codon:yes gene_type:complete